MHRVANPEALGIVPGDARWSDRGPFARAGDRADGRAGEPAAGGADAGSGAGEPPETAASVKPRKRRFLGPLALVAVGAVIAVVAYALVDSSGSSGGQASAPASTTTSTTAAPQYAAKVYKVIEPSLVFIETNPNAPADSDSAIGSGVVINAAGQIMTANHVIEGATTIQVTFADGSQTTAQVISSTPANDIAILQPDTPPGLIVPAVLGGGVQVGDDTYSVGNPLGLTGSLTAGVVSGLNRTIERDNGEGDLAGLIQFDAAVNPGSSGGPLLNRAGQVVGIVTALANPTNEKFFIGIGFAVPIGAAGGAAHVPDQ
jgi:S1-C subfamily serine protease